MADPVEHDLGDRRAGRRSARAPPRNRWRRSGNRANGLDRPCSPSRANGRAAGLAELEIGTAALMASASCGAICFSCRAPICEACSRSRAASPRGTAARASGEVKPGPLPFRARLRPANSQSSSIAATSRDARQCSRTSAGRVKAGSLEASAVINPPVFSGAVTYIARTALLQPEAPPGSAGCASRRGWDPLRSNPIQPIWVRGHDFATTPTVWPALGGAAKARGHDAKPQESDGRPHPAPARSRPGRPLHAPSNMRRSTAARSTIRTASGPSRRGGSTGSRRRRGSPTGRFDPVEIKWFEDGILNLCHNCVDRHLPRRARARSRSSGKATSRASPAPSPMASCTPRWCGWRTA